MKLRVVQQARDIFVLCPNGSMIKTNKEVLGRLLTDFKRANTFKGMDGYWIKENPSMDDVPGITLAFVDDANKLVILSDKLFSPEKEIIYVGRIEYNQKRTDRVIDIWKELESKYPDWKLTSGGDGEDREDLQKRIDGYGLKRVEITGFVDPIPYYKRASILLLTSEYEGFGLVIAEAMSHGVVPVVYNSFEAAKDLITDGHNGVLVDKPFSDSGFAEKVNELMDKPDYLNELSENGRIVSAGYSIDRIANEWYQLMDN